MAAFIYQFILTFLFVILKHSIANEEDLYSLVVEHSLDPSGGAVFTRRGVIDINSLKSGAASYTSEISQTDVDKHRLKELAETGGVYRVRVGKWSADGASISYVYSFIKACSLYESRLSNTLTVHIDQSGGLIAATLSSPIPYCTGHSPSVGELGSFNTTVEVQQTVTGPAPDTQAYIQKIEHEKMEKAKGQQGDNRSFFAKYWMYLVPLFLFMMILSNVDPNAAQGGGGR